MIPSGAEEKSEKTWSCDPVILRDLAFAAKRVPSPSASKIKQAAGCWSFGRGAKTVSGLLLLVLRKPHSSGRVPTDWIKCMLKHFIINSLPLMSINLFSQLKPQWFWWLRMLGGSATLWSPSPYCFPFLLLPIWVAVTFCRSSPTSTVLPGESHKAEPPLKGTRSSVGWCWGSSLTVLGRSRMDASQTSQLEPSLAVSCSVGRFIVGHYSGSSYKGQWQGDSHGESQVLLKSSWAPTGCCSSLLLLSKRGAEIWSTSAARHFPGNVKGHRNMTKAHKSCLLRIILVYFFYKHFSGVTVAHNTLVRGWYKKSCLYPSPGNRERAEATLVYHYQKSKVTPKVKIRANSRLQELT